MSSDSRHPDIPEGPTSRHTPPGDAAIPRIIDGRYVCQRELGRGGMGRVFVAHDLKIDRQVAVKILSPGPHGDDDLRRFELEVRAAGSLNHPGVLTVFDVGSHEGGPYMVTELLDGQTLRRTLAAGPLRPHAAMDCAAQLAHGLAAAHEKGIVHRDLKPENIFVTVDGRIKILDFGIAKLLAHGSGTAAGMVLGTAGYMSPEQIRGDTVDQRSDVFSFGAILYEMLCGRLAFPAATLTESSAAILAADPRPLPAGTPPALKQIVRRCLQKRAEDRYPSARELAADLDRAGTKHLTRKRWLVAGSIVLLACGAAVALVRREARMRWARRQAIPQIAELVEKNRYPDAFALAEKVEQMMPGDPMLDKLWPEMSRQMRVETDPPGAEISLKEYNAPEGAWRSLGRSPTERVRLPLAFYRFKIVKDGFAPVEAASSGLGQYALAWTSTPIGTGDASVRRTLDEAASIPADMVRVPGGKIELQIVGLEGAPQLEIDDFYIDRYEVTNARYKRFVDDGGYAKEEYWKEPFLKDGRAISFKEAVAGFRDRTDRPGPSTWELGDFPDGQEDLPVTGVSWYEAAAFAAFSGRSLPTVYHWSHAAGTWASNYIVPASNFSGAALAAGRSSRGVGPYGTYDMAGNAKEWCWNAMGTRRLILGGAFSEPSYMFNDPDAQSPFDRRPTYGFRLAKYRGAIPRTALDALVEAKRDYAKETPVSDSVFQAFKSLYRYDKAPLDARVEAVDDSSERWRKEKVSYAAAYGGERVPAYLFTPRRAAPPFQILLIFPGSGALQLRSSETLPSTRLIDFVLKSGRAVIYPVYKSTFERSDALRSDLADGTVFYRDHVVDWAKDVGRTIDYIESRKDLDGQKIAFYGFSWGAALGPLIAAVEERIKIAILVAGGLNPQRPLPEADPFNFGPRARQPMLLINGRYDYFFPIESSQMPFFRMLGAPAADKRQLIFETGHAPPNELLMKEILDWLDRYFGRVERQDSPMAASTSQRSR
ncbi:MAG: hypothetical protein E6J78_05390 [Deltaproteobacteria bacterium]|nr:MAG: hypothetical protein E6J78_05390 [Deltaproteobacteria bacterium]